MEVTASSVEDNLINGLSFKLRPGSSYITDKTCSTFHPSGSNIYTPTGTKVIKIVLSDSGWLDPSTLRIMFRIKNTADIDGVKKLYLRPLGGPWVFFRRIRLLANGTPIEDIDYYNRVHQMFDTLKPSETRINDQIEGMNNYSQEDAGAGAAACAGKLEQLNFFNYDWLGGVIPPQKSKWVMFQPLVGLLQQDKYIPLKYCPLTIELELVNNLTDCVITKPPDNTTGANNLIN